MATIALCITGFMIVTHREAYLLLDHLESMDRYFEAASCCILCRTLLDLIITPLLSCVHFLEFVALTRPLMD